MDSELAQQLLVLVVAGYSFGAVSGLLFAPRTHFASSRARVAARLGTFLGFGSAALSSFVGCTLSLWVLLSGRVIHPGLPHTLPFEEFSLALDPLGAFFLGVITLLGGVVSIYSLGYARAYLGRRNVGFLIFLYNLFLIAMVFVVLAANAILFLIVWEIMSLVTYFLINYEHEESASRKAGFQYVAMTHVGTAFLLAGFLVLSLHAQSFNFDAWKMAAMHIPDGERTAVFLCILVGFGMKAGIIPLHVWLPEAHPAAPSNVSALMSAVMIKTGIYGMVRLMFDILGPGPAWWGILILIIAVVSSVLGVLYALMEHDLKRLLAFHSIENIGIILMGVGGALLFSSFGNKTLAALALVAGMFHVLNHATFKGLLFLGAGSILHATGTRNIEEMGGLIRKLPYTALFFLVGAIAISGLPPLNGFASEWLTYQSLLLGFTATNLAAKITIPLAVALLALTGALAAACFVKAFGITFLGLPRSAHAGDAHESSFTMLAAMAVLATLCILFGVLPAFVIALINRIPLSLFGTQALVASDPGSLIISRDTPTSVSPAVLALLLLGLIVVPAVIGLIIGGRSRRRTAPTWACGLPTLTPRMQYSATGFSKPIRMIFSSVFRARHEIEIAEETSPWFRPEITFRLRTESVFARFLYEPLDRLILGASHVLRRIQTGHIQSYLAYIFLALIILLLFAR